MKKYSPIVFAMLGGVMIFESIVVALLFIAAAAMDENEMLL